jgi:hypothetical protein
MHAKTHSPTHVAPPHPSATHAAAPTLGDSKAQHAYKTTTSHTSPPRHHANPTVPAHFLQRPQAETARHDMQRHIAPHMPHSPTPPPRTQQCPLTRCVQPQWDHVAQRAPGPKQPRHQLLGALPLRLGLSQHHLHLVGAQLQEDVNSSETSRVNEENHQQWSDKDE